MLQSVITVVFIPDSASFLTVAWPEKDGAVSQTNTLPLLCYICYPFEDFSSSVPIKAALRKRFSKSDLPYVMIISFGLI